MSIWELVLCSLACFVCSFAVAHVVEKVLVAVLGNEKPAPARPVDRGQARPGERASPQDAGEFSRPFT